MSLDLINEQRAIRKQIAEAILFLKQIDQRVAALEPEQGATKHIPASAYSKYGSKGRKVRNRK